MGRALDTSSAATPSNALAIDVDTLHTYLLAQGGPLAEALHSGAPLAALKFSHGQSNPTYLLQCGPRKWVLRKKPPGTLLASAHAVDREFAALRALHAAGFPVPAPLTLCTEPRVLGTDFYVMQHVDGTIFLDPNLPDLPPAARARVYAQMCATLAALHRVDPAAVGLGAFGSAANYGRRQLGRWAKQYLASAPEPLPEMQSLMAWLQANVPASDASPRAAICHGDFRLDNLVLRPAAADNGDLSVVAVLDWELWTLGNATADLAYNCMAYHLPADVPDLPALRQPLAPGIPSEQEYVKMYCAAAGVGPPSPQEWAFYMGLSLFRLAAILAGVAARAKQGNASSTKAAAIGGDTVLRSLAARALAIIEVQGQGRQNRSEDSASACSRAAASAASISGRTAGSPSISAAATSGTTGSTAHGSGGSFSTTTSPSPPVPHVLPGAGQPSERVRALRARLIDFMREHVFPAEETLTAHASGPDRWTIHPLQEELKRKAKAAGLWNLWLPAHNAQRLSHLSPLCADDGERSCLLGAGLSNLEYAYLCEEMGRSVWAPEVFNCSAPDTGNMEVLAQYGSKAQQARWLLPLLTGRIRSCFAMTEKEVASSDATNIQASIVRSPDGQSYTVRGVKWWTSGASDPRCAVAIFMGKTDRSAAPHRQQSMILVPMDAPGVKVVRPMMVFGYDDAPHGHAEVHFTDVSVPAGNMLLGEGRGFEIAQGRLGPGRLHHCMRLIGAGERGMELMAARSLQRTVFGGPIARQGGFQAQLAGCRIQLDAARLMVLAAAAHLDAGGNKAAMGSIAAAKVAAPAAALRVLDQAIQVHGGCGVSQDTVLAQLWAGARTLRIADGPDEVHLGTIAKIELAAAKSRL